MDIFNKKKIKELEIQLKDLKEELNRHKTNDHLYGRKIIISTWNSYWSKGTPYEDLFTLLLKKLNLEISEIPGTNPKTILIEKESS